MERLTIRNSDGTVSQPTTTTVEAVFYKLADYEDTGLNPQEIKSLQGEWNANKAALDYYRKQLDSIVKKYGLHHDGRGEAILNLLKLVEDRRLVVLPCGDDVELVRDGETYKANHWNHSMTAFRDDPTTPSGLRVALFSIEEAGRALVTDKNVGRTIPVNDLYDEDGGDVLKGGGTKWRG